MDCSTALELIMKQLDGEILTDEKNILFEHMKSCKECASKYESLKTMFSDLDAFEMEEPPEGLEEAVISRIRAEDSARARIRAIAAGAIPFLLLCIGWGLIVLMFKYTPITGILISRFNELGLIIESTMGFILDLLHTIVPSVLNLVTVGRAMEIAGGALMDIYINFMASLSLLMMIILVVYGYMSKLIGR